MNSLPSMVVERLSGDALDEGEALCLSVAGTDGWPHLALLSAGEVLAVSPTELRLALHAGSGTTAGLEASGRALLLVAHDGAAVAARLTARPLGTAEIAGVDLARFAATVEDVALHRAPYAHFESGPRFRLTERDATLARWRETLASLEAAA